MNKYFFSIIALFSLINSGSVRADFGEFMQEAAGHTVMVANTIVRVALIAGSGYYGSKKMIDLYRGNVKDEKRKLAWLKAGTALSISAMLLSDGFLFSSDRPWVQEAFNRYFGWDLGKGLDFLLD